MAERRSKQQIIYDILLLIRKKNNKIKPTHILYGGNLSYNRMTLYLTELEEKNLIEKFSETKKKKTKYFYKLTQKGFEFLTQMDKVREIEDAFGI